MLSLGQNTRFMSSTPLSPELQQTLQELFELFSSYVEAPSMIERERLHAQILDLFSRLGVIGSNPLVRQAAEMFERIRVERRVPSSSQAASVNRARRLVDTRIRQFERETKITLTSGARQLLRTPVAEAVEFSEEIDTDEIVSSVDRILASLEEESPTTPREGTENSRTAIAVIRAFWKNFCNIPPFCAGRHG